MNRKNAPNRIWDYLDVSVYETGKSSLRYTPGLTTLEMITCKTPDISKYLDFRFYDWVTYRTNAGLGELLIGGCIRVFHKLGQLMSY